MSDGRRPAEEIIDREWVERHEPHLPNGHTRLLLAKYAIEEGDHTLAEHYLRDIVDKTGSGRWPV